MKKALALLLAIVMFFSFSACSKEEPKNSDKENVQIENQNEVVEEPVSNSAASKWETSQMVDEFGDPVVGGASYIRAPFTGDFSNSATNGSTLAGYIFMQMGEDYPTFIIRLLEYGDKPINFTGYDTITLKSKIDGNIHEYVNTSATPPDGDLITKDTWEVMYTALYHGTDVRCIAYIGNSQYNFTIPAAGFAEICKENGYITDSIYFSETDNETLYNEAKALIAQEKFEEAIPILEYLADYNGSKDLLKEVACKSYYAQADRKAWEQFFDVTTAVPLDDDELRAIIVGNWYSSPTAYSAYTEDGKYSYNSGTGNAGVENFWKIEGGRIIVDSKYTHSEKIVYPFYKNVYVICTPKDANKVTSDVYSLAFLNGPLE